LGDFTAFFAADFLAAGVFAAEDILSNKKGCWQPVKKNRQKISSES
jgi:hypothetical protein